MANLWQGSWPVGLPPNYFFNNPTWKCPEFMPPLAAEVIMSKGENDRKQSEKSSHHFYSYKFYSVGNGKRESQKRNTADKNPVYRKWINPKRNVSVLIDKR
jgi:hypothetical protein